MKNQTNYPMATHPPVTENPRRRRRNTKKLEALKAAAVILGLLFGCIIVLWLLTHTMHPHQAPQEFRHQPGNSMWDPPAKN